jgi:hypothetical protein
MSPSRALVLVAVPVSALALLWGCGDDPVILTTTDAGATALVGFEPCNEGGPSNGGAGAFVPSNFDPSLLDDSALRDIDVTEVDGGCAFDTDALTLTCAHQSFEYTVKSVEQAGGVPLAIFTVSSFTIEPGVVVDAFGKRPLVIDARGSVDIRGELRATRMVKDGLWAKPPSGSVPSGGPAFCGLASDSDGGRRGSASLVPLTGGSGKWATGGGAVQLSSTTSILVSGLIDVNGQGGVGSEFFGTCNADGASGGAILLEAPWVQVTGALAANGGSGGPGGGTSEGIARAPTDDSGLGAGSAGDDPNGQPGGLAVASCAVGGGGGAGWITIKTRSCTFKGNVSPTPNSGCANVLPLGR